MGSLALNSNQRQLKPKQESFGSPLKQIEEVSAEQIPFEASLSSIK